MGLVYAEIELINAGDLEMVRRNILDIDEVKRMQVEMLVDSGSYYVCINETVVRLAFPTELIPCLKG